MKRVLSILLALGLMLGLLPPGLAVSAAPTIVTEVRATVATPIIGYSLSKLNDTYTPTKGVEITAVNWTKSNGAIYPEGTKFAAGVTYYCDMEFTVKEGYTFPNSYTQLKGYINGVVGEISTVYYTDHAYVTAAFTPVSDGEVFVAGIGMNDGDYLPVGGTSTTKSKVSDRYAFYNDGVLTLHNYTFCGTGLVLPGSYSYFNAAIMGESLKEIVVEGNCELASTSDARYDECIWFFPDGMETRGTIRGNGDSQLSLSCSYKAIDATQGLTIQDATLTIQNAYDGLEAYGDIIVKNSTIDINVDFYAWYVKGNLSVTDSQLNIVSDGGPGLYVCGDAILDNSTIDVNSFNTALLTGIYDSVVPNSCDLSVMNCDLALVSKDSYGIFSEESALLYNSTVTIESVEEGIYAGKDLSINGSQAVIQTSEESAICCRKGNSFITSSTVTLPFAGNDGIKFYGDTLYITGSQVTVIQAGDCGIATFGHMVVANSELSLTGLYGIYSEGDLSIEGSELATIGKRYGILAYEDETDIAITDSYVLAASREKAALIADGGTLTIADDLMVQASTDPNGTLGTFDMANVEDYRLVLIHKHVSDAGTVTKKATCKATGTKTYKCTVCGEVLKTETIAKKAHSYNAATCTKAKTCKNCGATSGEKLGHDYEKKVTKATLTKDGVIKNVCKRCDYVASKTTAIYKASSIKLSKTSYTYNGKVQKPSVIVKDSKGNTISSSNYTVTYASGLKNAGTYTVKVTFKGNYSGTKTLSYTIKGIDVSKCKISLSTTSYTYNGSAKKPAVTVKNASGTKLTTSSYTVTYASGRKNVGTYKVTIKMKGNYTGTKTVTFKINPVKTSISSLTAGTKKLTVKWSKKSTQVTGYEIQYSTSKSFKSVKTKTVSSYKTTSATLSSLKAKTTYYVRVRTYKTVNGVKYYSGWSTVKRLKTK